MGWLRHAVETRGLWRRHAPDPVDQHRSPLHLDGCRRVAHLLRRSGSPSPRNAHRPHRRSRRDEVRRLAAIARGVRKAARRLSLVGLGRIGRCLGGGRRATPGGVTRQWDLNRERLERAMGRRGRTVASVRRRPSLTIVGLIRSAAQAYVERDYAESTSPTQRNVWGFRPTPSSNTFAYSQECYGHASGVHSSLWAFHMSARWSLAVSLACSLAC